MVFPNKKQVLQLVALLAAYQIKHIVLSPGSRNAPLIQAFSQHPYFECYSQVDERNAGFFALGLIQRLQQPVVICCTSGTALLNYGPAIAEAYYQHLPLIVISADRPQAWIGQMDGQTVPQTDCFNTITQCSVQLSEITTPEQEWYCNRLINQALIHVTHKRKRPVHINVPLSEPLFDYSVTSLPDVRKIDYCRTLTANLITDFQKTHKKIIIVGQLLPNVKLTTLLNYCAQNLGCVVLVEQLSNQQSIHFIDNFDAILASLSSHDTEQYCPELVITLGGHIVSKRIKQFLRQHAPQQHWHVGDCDDIVDLFQCVSQVIDNEAEHFLAQLNDVQSTQHDNNFIMQWQHAKQRIPQPSIESDFSDISVIGQFVQHLPNNALLHTANSSAVRHLQLFRLPQNYQLYCNRGTNGIDGTLSSLTGFAIQSDTPVFLIIGDLSFFYNINALWQNAALTNLRILLLNNGGGGIFHLLPNLNEAASLNTYVAAEHHSSAEKWVNAVNFDYFRVTQHHELVNILPLFTDPHHNKSMVVEVVTDMAMNKSAYTHYYQSIRHAIRHDQPTPQKRVKL